MGRSFSPRAKAATPAHGQSAFGPQRKLGTSNLFADNRRNFDEGRMEEGPVPDITTQMAHAVKLRASFNKNINQAAVQRQAEEEEDLKLKPETAVQRQAAPEEEEELQTKPQLQRETMPEEEEELQTKPQLQREAMPEEEEELQMRPQLQREAIPEEDEKLQAKLQLQREAMPEEEEDLQAKAIQPKLTIGHPGDKYEQEADSMAAKVMSTPDSAVQREAMPEEDEELQAKPQLQREAMPEEEDKTLQAKPDNPQSPIQNPQSKIQAKGEAPTAPANFDSQLAQHKGSGQPLSDDTRAFMEPRFGADFSNVRVHETPDLANAIQARAFTHGQDIYFNSGKYNPGSSGGKELLAHELTHVVQQGRASNSAFIRRETKQGNKSHAGNEAKKVGQTFGEELSTSPNVNDYSRELTIVQLTLMVVNVALSSVTIAMTGQILGLIKLILAWKKADEMQKHYAELLGIRLGLLEVGYLGALSKPPKRVKLAYLWGRLQKSQDYVRQIRFAGSTGPSLVKKHVRKGLRRFVIQVNHHAFELEKNCREYISKHHGHLTPKEADALYKKSINLLRQEYYKGIVDGIIEKTQGQISEADSKVKNFSK